jgi:hypothetical protein
MVFFLILLSNVGYLPLGKGDFAFFVFLLFMLTLYRPSWGFLFFVGTIMLENINLAPLELGLAVRPYQLIGGMTVLALLIRFLTKRLNFALAKFTLWDGAVILLGAGSFLSLANAPAKGASFKQAVIMLSYIALYFLVRNFLQTKEDLKRVLPFFISSSMVVVGYSIWQNIRFLQGGSHFEVMPGRPNGTFAEPDWMGIFLVLLLAVLYALMHYFYKNKDSMESQSILNFKFRILNYQWGLYIFLVLTYIALILTVARSAWVGALAVTVVFLVVVFTQLKMNYRSWQWKDVIRMKLTIIPLFVLSIASVYFLHLTNFQLGNRAQSTGSGMQEITISCENGIGDWKAVPITTPPLSIENMDELEQYHCRHINLEEIDAETASGRFITTALRKDPNVNIRAEIYQKSWVLVKSHPILGIGWGSVSGYLGTDERGAGLNASNIFLETWLGAGLLGLASLVVLLGFVLYNSIRFFLYQDQFFGLFLLLGLTAIIIPNLFNSGIFLGFVWLFLGLGFIKK